MTTPTAPTLPDARKATCTLGVVSFLNALPLYDALLGEADCRIVPAVPSRLIDLLDAGECDLAMLPVVDAWRARRRLTLVSDGCIASDGETLTVRVYSRVPCERVTRLHVDGDSHTSVLLARVLWHELYGRGVEIVPWQIADGARGVTAPAPVDAGVEALLLIGDKVVRNAPRGFGFEMDLGAAWKHLAGLPFVFAAWYGEAGRDWSAIAARCAGARDKGVRRAEQIARAHAAAHGWPEEIAVQYLRDIMRYRLTEGMRESMDRFAALVERHGLLP